MSSVSREDISSNPADHLSELDKKPFIMNDSETYEDYRDDFRFKSKILSVFFYFIILNIVIATGIYFIDFTPNSFVTTQAGQIIKVTPYLISN